MRRNGRYGRKDFFEKSRKVIKYELIVCLRKKRGPRSKPRLRLFAMGRKRAEVRVAFNDRAEQYHSRNLVTERATKSPNA